MTTRFSANFFGGFIVVLFGCTITFAAKPNAKVVEHIDSQVIPAYQSGNPVYIVESISALLDRLGDQPIQDVDDYFTKRGFPSLVTLITDARLEMVETGDPGNKLRVSEAEAKVMMPQLKQRIEDVNGGYDRHPLAQQDFPAPADWETYDQIFWDVHVFQNKLAVALRYSQFAEQVTKPMRKKDSRRSKPEPDQQSNNADSPSPENWLIDYAQVTAGIERRVRELYEREIELRIYRVEDAHETLADTAASKTARFQAAFALEYDANELGDYFTSLKSKSKDKQAEIPTRSSLTRTGLESQVSQLIEDGRNSAGDSLRKAKLLFVGMHYWTRGRYGAGPQAWGLLKHETAIASETAMFPLFMPAEPQPATDPMQVSVGKSPQLDRRHHYAWAAEYRPFSMSASGSSQRAGSSVTSSFAGERTTTQMSRFY